MYKFKDKQVKINKRIRLYRKIHRISGISLATFFLIMALSGFLLGLKKHSGELIQAKTHKGVSNNSQEWLSIDSLQKLATIYLRDSVSPALSNKIDRAEVRMRHGMVKFTYTDHFKALQIDATTGELLFIETRRSDFIEAIHDGSILDFYLGNKGEPMKVTYSSIMGIALTLFVYTGFWLWFGPRRIKQLRRKETHRQKE